MADPILTISAVVFKAKLKKVKKKKKRGEGEVLDDRRLYATKIFAKFSHDGPLPMVKKKHLTIEQLNARRRKVWLTIAKKEVPKVGTPEAVKNSEKYLLGICWERLILILFVLQTFKQKTSAKNLMLTNSKKVKCFTPLFC